MSSDGPIVESSPGVVGVEPEGDAVGIIGDLPKKYSKNKKKKKAKRALEKAEKVQKKECPIPEGDREWCIAYRDFSVNSFLQINGCDYENPLAGQMVQDLGSENGRRVSRLEESLVQLEPPKLQLLLTNAKKLSLKFLVFHKKKGQEQFHRTRKFFDFG